MGHKYSEREKELIDHTNYGAYLENCKDFIKSFFKKNYSMIYTDHDFLKNLKKKLAKDDQFFDPSLIDRKDKVIKKT